MEELWVKENISLVCPTCHVPERKMLNYSATIQKFEAGITPDDIEDWIAGLPLKIKELPGFYWDAKGDYYERP